MNHRAFPIPSPVRFLHLLLFVAGLIPVQAQTAVVHLKGGQSRSGTVLSVSRSDIKLRLPNSGSSVGFAYKDVQHIEFPVPREWSEAMRLFYAADYAGAAEQLEPMARSGDRKKLFYPAPGNFISYANRRLIDCYQRLVQLDKLVPVVSRIEWQHLPEAEREAGATAEAWAACGLKDWDKALSLITVAEFALTPEDPRQGELAYLRGLAAEGQGDADSAVLNFALVYGPYPGANRRLASDALQRAAILLSQAPARKPELKALLQIYAKSFGNGKLWETASPQLQELMAQP